MKKIAPIILSSLLLFPGSSNASDRSHHQINSASSQQISQTPPIDTELEGLRQADSAAAQKIKQIATATPFPPQELKFVPKAFSNQLSAVSVFLERMFSVPKILSLRAGREYHRARHLS